MLKTPPANAGDVRGMGWIPGSGRSPGGRGNGTLESHGQSGLEGYSPWSHKESDTTEQVNNNNKCVYTLRIYLQHGQMFRVSTYKSKIQALITS